MDPAPRARFGSWIALCLGLALFVGAGIALRPARPAAPAAPTGDPADGQRGEEVLPLASPARPTSLQPESERAAIEGSLPASDAAPPAREPAGPAELRIEVVDAATLAPVPGAEVHCLDLGPDAAQSANRSEGGAASIDELLAAGTPLVRTTDEVGVARVPQPRGRTVIAARTDTRYGSASLTPPVSDRVRIAIAPDWSLPIQVVDRAGRGVAGVPVSLRHRSRRLPSYEAIVARTEGPDGIASLRHAGSWIARSKTGETWLAAVATVLREPLEQELDPSRPPEEPIRFVLPETGSAVVELLDADGTPCLDPVTVRLRAVQSPPAPGLASPPALVRTREGKAPFGFVELGLELAATAKRERGVPFASDAVGPGPLAAGELATLEFRFGAHAPVLQGRLVRSSGVPVADAELSASLEAPPSWVDFRVRTDPGGRFRFDLSRELAQESGLGLTITDRATGDAAPRVAVASGLGPGLHELGDIVLGAAPLIAGGTIADSSGAPIAGVDVSAHVRRNEGTEGGGRFHWDRISAYAARSDGAGRFALRGEFETPGPILVSAEQNGFASAGVECRVGATDLALELAPGGRVAGRLAAAAGFPFHWLQIELHDGARAAHPFDVLSRARLGNPDASGRFELGELPAGVYSLRISDTRGAASADPLVEIDDVVVEAGRTCGDPRLAEIDLRGRAIAVTLRFVDTDGRPVRRGTARVRPSGGGAERIEGFHTGELSLIGAQPPLDVTVWANGFRQTAVEGIPGDRPIVLEPGIRVRVALRDPAALPRPPFELTARLRPVGDEGHLPGGDWTVLDERGEAALCATAPGRVQVQWLLRKVSFATTWASGLELAKPVEIEVADAGGEQTFELALDADAVARAVARADG